MSGYVRNEKRLSRFEDDLYEALINRIETVKVENCRQPEMLSDLGTINWKRGQNDGNDEDGSKWRRLMHQGNWYIREGRYGVSVPTLTKDHKGIKLNTPYPEDQYTVLEIWNEYNILEDIKRGPYSKKSTIRRIQSLDTPNDINIELNKEFLEELQMNAYHGWIDEDVINHIAMVLKMIDSIYIPGVDQLRMKIFPPSLADEAKQWWINEGERKITVWEELVEKFFCKFYPESYDGEEEMLDEGDNWGIDPLEFISRVNSSFDKHMKMDGRTKKVLFHAWMNGDWNKRRIDKSVLRSNKRTTDSFFKPYLVTHRKSNTEKEGEQSQTKRKYSNTSNSIDEQPNKRRCKAEKFKAIQYLLGPNEEYIAIRSYEYNIWERNEDNMSKIYQDIFQKKDEGWKCFPGDNPDCYLILSSLFSQTSIRRIRSIPYGVLRGVPSLLRNLLENRRRIDGD
ncbi:hypothetical protein Tco_1291802 [Tanacetum coccineum]